MKALENRTVDSKREMDILDALQDIRARNARNERVGHSVDLVAQLGMEEIEDAETAEQKRLEEEDEKLVKEVFFRVSIPGSSTSAPPPKPSGETGETSEITPPPAPSPSVLVKRKADDNEPSLHSLLPESTRALINTKAMTINMNKKKKTDEKNSFGIKFGKKPKAKAAAV
jgi:Saf4/Yju2 protein